MDIYLEDEILMDIKEVKKLPGDEVVICEAINRSNGKKVKLLVADENTGSSEALRYYSELSLDLPREHFIQKVQEHKKTVGNKRMDVYIFNYYEDDLLDYKFKTWDQLRECVMDFIKALSYLHDKKRISHRGLRNKYNLVVQNGRGFLMGVVKEEIWQPAKATRRAGTSGDASRDSFKEDVFAITEAMKDIFVTEDNEHPEYRLEFKLFLDYLTGFPTWVMIINHPFLLDYKGKLYYIFMASKYFNEMPTILNDLQKNYINYFIDKDLDDKLIYMDNWQNNVIDRRMRDLLEGDNQYGTKPLEFLRFLRNCISHADIKVEGENGIGVFQQEVNVYIHFKEMNANFSKVVPGFLCSFYETLCMFGIFIFNV